MSSKIRFAAIVTCATLFGWLSSVNASSAELAPVANWSPAGNVLLTRDEALALAFPKCEIERKTVYLEESSTKAIAKLAKVDFSSKVVYTYSATRDGKWVGTAYFDTHRVRTLRETLMIVVEPKGTIGRVELLSFAEPRDYIPRDAWYAQFVDRKLDDDLNLNRKIRGTTGATLTSQATTRSARRTLALHSELQRLEAEKKASEKKAKEKKAREKKGKKKSVGSEGSGTQ